MTEHNGLPVSGYNPQSPENVARVNRNKELEERCIRAAEEAISSGADPYMAGRAIMDLKQAFMWLNRSIFQPGRIRLPEDN